MGLLVKLFLRHADTGFVLMAHRMYMERRMQDMAQAVYGNQAQPSPSSSDDIPSRRSSGRRAASHVVDWSTKFRYEIPMSGMPPSSMRLVTGRAEQSLDSNIQNLQTSGWQNQVHECDDERAAPKILGIGSVT